MGFVAFNRFDEVEDIIINKIKKMRTMDDGYSNLCLVEPVVARVNLDLVNDPKIVSLEKK